MKQPFHLLLLAVGASAEEMFAVAAVLGIWAVLPNVEEDETAMDWPQVQRRQHSEVSSSLKQEQRTGSLLGLPQTRARRSVVPVRGQSSEE